MGSLCAMNRPVERLGPGRGVERKEEVTSLFHSLMAPRRIASPFINVLHFTAELCSSDQFLQSALLDNLRQPTLNQWAAAFVWASDTGTQTPEPSGCESRTLLTTSTLLPSSSYKRPSLHLNHCPCGRWGSYPLALFFSSVAKVFWPRCGSNGRGRPHQGEQGLETVRWSPQRRRIIADSVDHRAIMFTLMWEISSV